MLSDVCIIRHFFKKVNSEGVRGQKKTKPELAISGLILTNFNGRDIVPIYKRMIRAGNPNHEYMITYFLQKVKMGSTCLFDILLACSV